MKKALKIIFSTIFFIIITHYLMAVIHVLIHSTLTWSFGFIKTPFDIPFISLTFFLVDKSVNFDVMINAHREILAAFIAIIPNLVNGFFALFCLLILSNKELRNKYYLYSFIFWFMIMNLGQVYSYTYRSFEMLSDVDVFVKALHISTYWVFFPAMIFLVYCMFNTLKYQIPIMYKVQKIFNPTFQAIYLFFVLFILFGYFGGILYNILTKEYYYLIYPICMVALFFIICFPKNKWVQNALLKD